MRGHGATRGPRLGSGGPSRTMRLPVLKVEPVAKKQSPLKRIFAVLWRTVAVVYGVLMLLLLLAVPIAFYFAYSGSGAVSVEDETALVWAPRGTLIEQRDAGVPTSLVAPLVGRPDPETVVADLVTALERAAEDERIEMAFLKLDKLGGATSGQLEELTAAIDRFKQSGKKVVAWSPTYNQSQYRLAAHADTVYLDPMGYVFLEGFGVFHKYFADALDKLGVKIHVFRVGEYKSFVEPFVRNDMSPQARAANRAWLESLWQAYKKGVTGANDLKPEAIGDYVDDFDASLKQADGNAAEVAKQAGLVDKLAPVAAMRDDMRAVVGTDEQHGSFRQIHHRDYLRATDGEPASGQAASSIAKVVVEGPIVTGKSVRGAAGGKTISELIRRVRRDDHAAAMVLRINSPGGSVFASERIRRQVEQMREAGKPVVVSMAGTAASGGYWIAMNADRIYAHPSTITGSIGVFGVVPTYAEPLAEIGVHTDGLGTTPLTGALRGDRSMQPQVKRILQSGVEHVYDSFIGKVAEARGMSEQAVDKIAQGRVWSGADAQRIGLVDEMGGLNAAEAAAADMAGLAEGDYALETIRQQAGWRSMFFQFFQGSGQVPLVPDWLARVAETPSFNWLRHGFDDPRGVYAHCFCEPAAADASP